MDSRLTAPWIALRLGVGLTALLAGIDKYFNLLTDWSAYLSPLAVELLPVAPATFMAVVGVVEIAVGVVTLAGWTRWGPWAAAIWLVGIAANLVLAGYFDVAVRDLIMALAAFTLARLEEIRVSSAVQAFAAGATPARGRVTA